MSETQATDMAQEPVRVLAGLQEGRIVNYVMRDGAIRPLLVVAAGLRTGTVNGILFFDPELDRGNHPIPLTADHTGFAPLCVRPLARVDYREYSEGEILVPGTWHWPTKQPIVAAAVSAEAMNVPFDALVARITAVVNEQATRLNDMVNAKLASTVEHVNKLLDSHSDSILAMVAPKDDAPVPSGSDGGNTGNALRIENFTPVAPLPGESSSREEPGSLPTTSAPSTDSGTSAQETGTESPAEPAKPESGS